MMLPIAAVVGQTGSAGATLGDQAEKMALVLALSFLTGFDREEHKQAKAVWTFGGVRTFPLIGLSSYALALIGGSNLVPWSLGLAVVGGFMLLSYQHKVATSEQVSATSELSALTTYLAAGLVVAGQYWIAVTIAVMTVLLIELKDTLEGLSRHVEANEIATVAQFLLLTVVVLPLVPNREFTQFAINPFRTWLIVIAVSGISFGSYVIQRLLKGRGGIFLSAVLGGAYSSTVTTVVLARQARDAHAPNLFAGGILAASGVMYVRLLILVAFFNPTLAVVLLPGFAIAATAGVAAGWLVSRRHATKTAMVEPGRPTINPLDLKAAVLFAIVFVGVVIVTGLAREYLGRAGLYSLAAVMGFTDVDPFILGVSQPGPDATPLHAAAVAIVIASSSNNVIKAIYARGFADSATGRRSLWLLAALAAVGALGLVWV